jgi:hypothetical protein
MGAGSLTLVFSFESRFLFVQQSKIVHFKYVFIISELLPCARHNCIPLGETEK